jgi:hypothetical protein
MEGVDCAYGSSFLWLVLTELLAGIESYLYWDHSVASPKRTVKRAQRQSWATPR